MDQVEIFADDRICLLGTVSHSGYCGVKCQITLLCAQLYISLCTLDIHDIDDPSNSIQYSAKLYCLHKYKMDYPVYSNILTSADEGNSSPPSGSHFGILNPEINA